jgi:hypothetical protein
MQLRTVRAVCHGVVALAALATNQPCRSGSRAAYPNGFGTGDLCEVCAKVSGVNSPRFISQEDLIKLLKEKGKQNLPRS